jgi:hypothetical protein
MPGNDAVPSGIPRHQPAVHRDHGAGQERCGGLAPIRREVKLDAGNLKQEI